MDCLRHSKTRLSGGTIALVKSGDPITIDAGKGCP